MKKMKENYNEQEKELIKKLQSLQQTEVDLDFIEKFRKELAQKVLLEEKTAQKSICFRTIILNFSKALSILLVFIIFGFGIVKASQSALPNNLLYPVKLATEKIQLDSQKDETAKLNLRVKFAQNRINEVKILESQEVDNLEHIKNTILKYQDEINNIERELDNLVAKNKDENTLESLIVLENELNNSLKEIENLTSSSSLETINLLNYAKESASSTLSNVSTNILEYEKLTLKVNNDPLADMRIKEAYGANQKKFDELNRVLEEKISLNKKQQLSKIQYQTTTLAPEKIPVDLPKEILDAIALKDKTQKELENLKSSFNFVKPNYSLQLESLRNIENSLKELESKISEIK
jgi:hypothetical protein